jgi:murein DD-endopeptidase MepM/ murein hydrolase activator NlpD
MSDAAAIIERAKAAAGSQPANATPSADRERLKHIAAEFESMLLVQVLKDMRRAGSWEEEEGGVGLPGAESLFETLDLELASHLSRVRGLGLSPQLAEAFERLNPEKAAGDDAVARQPQAMPIVAPGPRPDAAAGARPGAWPDAAAPASALPPPSHANPVATAVRAIAGAAVDAPKAVAQIVRPVAGAVTSAFGWRHDPMTREVKFHQGVDLRAAYGQEVQAAGAGRVVFSGDQGGYGSTVVVEHGDGTKTRYAHLSARLVEKGAVVDAGSPIGRAGKSGRATGTHLHFEVIAADGRRLPPDAWVR